MADPNSTNPAQDWQSRITNFVNASFQSFGTAAVEVQSRNYSADKLVSDTLSWWKGLTSVWGFPVELALDKLSAAVPEVHIQRTTADTQGTGACPIPNRGVYDVTTEDPTYDDGTAISVEATITGEGSVLLVTFEKAVLKVGTCGQGKVRNKGTGELIATIKIDVT